MGVGVGAGVDVGIGVGPGVGAATASVLPSAEGPWQAPLRKLLQAVVTLARARAGTLRLLDPADGGLLLICAVGDIGADQLEARRRPGSDCGVCGDALRLDRPRCAAASCACSRAVVHLPSVRPTDSSPLTGSACSSPDLGGRSGGLCVDPDGDNDGGSDERVFVLPLHHGAAPCGVLNLFFDTVCEVPDALQTLLPAMGDMLGLALENHRLARQVLHDSVSLERTMLAGEVHDSLAQSLTWLRMRVALLRGAIDHADDAAARRYLAEIDSSLAGAHGRMRELICDFRTRMDPQGLLQALRQVVEQARAMSGARIDLVDQTGAVELSAEQELQVFHIVREAIANIVKHARASRAVIRLAHEQDSMQVTVEDNGVGLTRPEGEPAQPQDRHGHFGLDLMRERARLIGGRIEWSSHSGRGTLLNLRFPTFSPGTAPTPAVPTPTPTPPSARGPLAAVPVHACCTHDR